MSLRFSDSAAQTMRREIHEAGGVEVFAIGQVEQGQVISLTVVCRGQEDRVLALIGRPHAGQVVIHNHPSGVLQASDADMRLAGVYGEDGVGFVITNNEVTASLWVVEPFRKERRLVPGRHVEAFFTRGLPKAIDGFEARDTQKAMSHAVAHALNDAHHLLCEAGTGTGKSLAYLGPAALWALKNNGLVVISTHTRALQAQLVSSDLKLLEATGLSLKTAVLEGRGNYLCKRRLGIAAQEQLTLTEQADPELDALMSWASSTTEGSRRDLPENITFPTWERVASDSDLTLRAKCSHYNECHFYQARRQASDANLLVVNHALLLADLALKAETGRGFLPKFDRLIIDEAQHLEDVATGAATEQVSSFMLTRALTPLTGSKRRPGALRRLQKALTMVPSLHPERLALCESRLTEAHKLVAGLRVEAGPTLDELINVLSEEHPTLRAEEHTLETEEWTQQIEPTLSRLALLLDNCAGTLHNVAEALDEVQLDEVHAQPLLEINRARRKLSGYALTLRTFLEVQQDDQCRWIQRQKRRNREPSAIVCVAPIDVAPTLRRVLWDAVESVVATSATLTVGGRFQFWKSRVGLYRAREAVFPSPFDYPNQALLGLPTDTAQPNSPEFLRQTAHMLVEAIMAAGGGVFVLCTSYRAVKAYSAALAAALPSTVPILSQGSMGRARMLERFRELNNAVLVGTDSFWEGVSVKGDALRLVIIPRLPFRVPDDPLRKARQQRLTEKGLNPFTTLTLPDAILKLRQGFGRLIRSTTDRGVVLIFDPRLFTKRYGGQILKSLPPAAQQRGSWTGQIAPAVRTFFSRNRSQGETNQERRP